MQKIFIFQSIQTVAVMLGIIGIVIIVFLIIFFYSAFRWTWSLLPGLGSIHPRIVFDELISLKKS